MHASHRRIRALTVGIALFALLSVAAGGTIAGSSNPPTLYACYNVYGQVSLSDVNQCKLAGGGRIAYWSTAGIPGPTGAQGPTGPQGPTGATGAAGASGPLGGYEVITISGTLPLSTADTVTSGQAQCTAGKRALGGGGQGAFNDASDAYTGVNPDIRMSAPWVSSPDGWTVGFGMPDGSHFPSGWTLDYTVYVICASVAP